MEREFLFLAVVGVVTLALVWFSYAELLDQQEVVISGSTELYWSSCDTTINIGHQADCELRQALVDANLWGERG